MRFEISLTLILTSKNLITDICNTNPDLLLNVKTCHGNATIWHQVTASFLNFKSFSGFVIIVLKPTGNVVKRNTWSPCPAGSDSGWLSVLWLAEPGTPALSSDCPLLHWQTDNWEEDNRLDNQLEVETSVSCWAEPVHTCGSCDPWADSRDRWTGYRWSRTAWAPQRGALGKTWWEQLKRSHSLKNKSEP